MTGVLPVEHMSDIEARLRLSAEAGFIIAALCRET
jgi:hypothetical protein